jgi:hypothetical protein
MQSAIVFFAVFGGLFVLRFLIATAFFLWILPEGDACPVCNSPTLRVQSPGWNRLFPRLRTSWCYECGWDGLLQPGPMSEPIVTMEQRQATRR